MTHTQAKIIILMPYSSILSFSSNMFKFPYPIPEVYMKSLVIKCL